MFHLWHKFKKDKVTVPSLSVDIHSHLIPSIDDGARSMDESLMLINALVEYGYKKLIITPHLMCDAYGNTKVSILQDFEKLKAVVKSESIDVILEVAAEYYVDEGFLKLIQTDELLSISNKYILFETSYIHRPIQLEEIIYEIQVMGYIPLLAHPERYRYITDKKEFFDLKLLGVEFQVNLNSFSGYYGKNAQKNALILSQEGLIDFLGSDTHNLKQVNTLDSCYESKIYKDIYLHNTIKNNLC